MDVFYWPLADLERVPVLALAALLAVGTVSHVSAQTPPTTTINFQTMSVAASPPGFTQGVVGGGGPADWKVVEEAGGERVLAQTSANKTDRRFPVILYDALTVRDVDVTVKFKPISGSIDRAAGIVVRARDAENYYVVRANALEDNVNLYKMVSGRRSEITGVHVKVPSGQWQTLRVKVEGGRFDIFFNDKPLFQAEDKTFGGAGWIGLWTKADSVTYFDDLVVTPGQE